MTNENFRTVCKKNAVPLWAVAERLGISEPTMSRKMRHELSEVETRKMLTAVEAIVDERELEAGHAGR